jgi:hypothetical protein
MIGWIKSLFAWRVVRVHACWIYEENSISGRRRVWTIDGAGHAPLDWTWLLTGREMPDIDGHPAWRSRLRNTLPDGWQWA